MAAVACARLVFTAVSVSRCVSASMAPATLSQDIVTVTQGGRVSSVTLPVLQVSDPGWQGQLCDSPCATGEGPRVAGSAL